MGRLIDADKFAEIMKKFSESDTFKEDCRKAYESVYLMLTVDKEKYSPTAYDVDKVVEEINEVFCCKDCEYADDECSNVCATCCEKEVTDDICRIVRKGGVNE